jgi:hypothetical protein
MKAPPMKAPIMLPISPLQPNHKGKIPRRITGRYSIVKFGTAIKPDRKKNMA